MLLSAKLDRLTGQVDPASTLVQAEPAISRPRIRQSCGPPMAALRRNGAAILQRLHA
jgi:hypothetical protein